MSRVAPESALRAILIASAGVQELVQDKIFPSVAPMDAVRPFVTYECAGIGRQNTLAGDGGLAMPSIIFTIVCDTYDEAYDIADCMRFAVNGLQFSYDNGQETVQVQRVSLADESTGYADDPGAETGAHTRTQTYQLSVRERTRP